MQLPYRIISPNRNVKHHSRRQVTSPDEFTSPEKKHAEKVKGLLELIDAQFESMHQYNQSCENQFNFHTEPCEIPETNQLKKTKSTERGENRYKSALSNMLNLVNSETLKSQKLSNSITSKQRSKWDNYQTPNKKGLTTTIDQSVDVQNQSQGDCSKIKTQGTNVSIDASCQTKANKQKKMGYFVYQLSYQSPKCNHQFYSGKELLDKSNNQQIERAKSNYINCFEEPTKKTLMEQCFGDNNHNKTNCITRKKNGNESTNQNKKTFNLSKQIPKNLISCLQIVPRRTSNTQQQNLQNIKVFSPPMNFGLQSKTSGMTKKIY